MQNKVYRRILSITMIVGLMLGVVLLQAALMLVMIVILRADLRAIADNDPVFMTIFYIVYSWVGITLMFIIRYLIQRFSLIQPMQIGEERKLYKNSFFGLLVLGIAIQLASSGILNIIYTFASDTAAFKRYEEVMNSLNGTSIWLTVLYGMLFAPVLEELIFRGLLIDFARYGFAANTSIIISAVCFGVFHGNIVQGSYAVVIGLILGYVRIRSGSLIDSIILHMIINISGVIVLPILTGIISLITGTFVAYGVLSVIGVLLSVMWYLKSREEIEDIKRYCHYGEKC